ncbi:CBS domain-containing protein [Paraburkholderia sp. BL23I1N1]|uniref:CBS domain-containing protein n=1 Tax=Paraburkholderia sp. BL23I1N1 TaxID=1938802 RepID=UPI0038F7E4EA
MSVGEALATYFGPTQTHRAYPVVRQGVLAVHGLERLPVVADSETLQLIGIVSRSDLVKPSLAHFDEEQKKERFRRLRVNTGKRHFPPVP